MGFAGTKRGAITLPSGLEMPGVFRVKNSRGHYGLNLEPPVVWDWLAADRARVQATVWVLVAVQSLASALVTAAASS